MTISDADIRAKILRLHYDLQRNRPGDDFNVDELPKLISGVPQNDLDFNLLYLCESRLIRIVRSVPNRKTPLLTRIAKLGIDVVQNPNRHSDRPINYQVLNVSTNYGLVAQAGQGATVSQTLTYSSFNDLRQLVDNHTELKGEEKKEIESVLAKLEELTNKEGLTKTNIDKAKEALARYGWLIQPLIQVLMKLLGLG